MADIQLKNVKFEKVDEGYWISNARVIHNVSTQSNEFGEPAPVFEIWDLNSAYLQKKDRKKGFELWHLGKRIGDVHQTLKSAKTAAREFEIDEDIIERFTLSVVNPHYLSDEDTFKSGDFYVLLNHEGFDLAGEYQRKSKWTGYYPIRLENGNYNY